MASSDVLVRAATPMRTATTARRSTTTARLRSFPARSSRATSRSSATSGATSSSARRRLLELWWPDSSVPRRPASTQQALRGRTTSSGSDRSPAEDRSRGSTNSAPKGHRLLHATASSTPASGTCAGRLRLQPRAARAPAQRLGTRLPAAAGAALLAWEGETDIDPPTAPSAGSCGSTATGPPKDSATTQARLVRPDAVLESPTTTTIVRTSSSSTTAPGASTRTSTSSAATTPS